MFTTARLKLDMATSVRDFCAGHAYDNNPKYQVTLTGLSESLARARALESQERSGDIGATTATASKAALRQQLKEQPLKHLERMAEDASAEQPELAEKFRLPRRKLSHQVFLAAARTMAADAETFKDVFTSYGMPPTFLDDLKASLDQYDRVVNQKHAATSAHVGARAELRALLKAIMALVNRLDTLNRYRFQNDAEQLAAWESARNVAWPARGAAKTPKPESGKTAA